MSSDSCNICGGDGRISNSFGLSNKCPGCHGTGRRGNGEPLMRDVTKTKPSHHRQPTAAGARVRKQWPDTFEGARLATEIQSCSTLTLELRNRLVSEVIDYEESHATCTQTFQKKIRKQLRAG